MSFLLDILGSTVVGAFVILMLVNFNVQLNTFSSDMLSGNITQGDAIVSGQIIEYDLYKIGYKANGNKITYADSIRITYNTDLQNKGVVDSVTYRIGTTNDLSSTSNPDDRPLLRIQDNQSPIRIAAVSDFKIEYYDSIGTEITTLSSQAKRDEVRTLKISIRFEAPEAIDGYYQGVDWERIIRPKNLLN